MNPRVLLALRPTTAVRASQVDGVYRRNLHRQLGEVARRVACIRRRYVTVESGWRALPARAWVFLPSLRFSAALESKRRILILPKTSLPLQATENDNIPRFKVGYGVEESGIFTTMISLHATDKTRTSRETRLAV
ncbi:hypothetical protein J6590_047212 [Homalodisca vitripennis]|nr:hypothetical protein J6590_047212 [Homalodisca vitripennis]